MLTPQAIKDQEFQIKFRGYDAIEVRAYLELLADDYFELTEQNRAQVEEIESLQEELESLQKDKDSVAAELKVRLENVDTIQADIEESYKHKDIEIEELISQIEILQAEKTADDEMSRKHLEKISELEEQLMGDRGVSLEDRAEIVKLRARIEVLEQQNNEMKQEGIDFKTTILAAQKFADNLRETSQLEADKLMEEALLEVEKFRTEAEAELSKLPLEIEALNRRKQEVREELKTVLHSYLSSLDAFSDTSPSELEDESLELFERIEIPESNNDNSAGA